MEGTALVQTEIAVILDDARRALAEKRTDDAISLLLSVTAPSAEVSLMLGAAYSEKRDYDSALRWFQSAVSIQSTARNYFNLAALHKMRNSPDEARTALREALNLDPTYEKARQMLETLPPEPSIGAAPPMPPPAPANEIFPDFAGGDPLRQSMYPSAMPKPEDAGREKPSYVPSDTLFTFRCTRLIERFGDWWGYIGWMAFLTWFIVPMASGSIAGFIVLSLIFAAWWIVDICDQLVPWYHVAGGLTLIIIGVVCPGMGRMLLLVGTWSLYWFTARD
jgi:hypothetical protein